MSCCAAMSPEMAVASVEASRIEEFRLYDTALDWTQVAFSNVQGPDVPFVVVPEPTATAMLIPGAIALAALSRRRRAGEPRSAEGPRGKSS